MGVPCFIASQVYSLPELTVLEEMVNINVIFRNHFIETTGVHDG